MTNIVWFQQDLRLRDHPALYHACQTGQPIIPLYILDDDTPGNWKMGSASRWWLHHSLEALDADLREHGTQLILLKGDPLEILPHLVKKHTISGVYWNRCYEPHAIKRDEKLKKILPHTFTFNSSLLFEPRTILNEQKQHFKCFTPFWNKCLKVASIDEPLPLPRHVIGKKIDSEKLEKWNLLPHHPDWAGGIRKIWQVGERAALSKLRQFIKHRLVHYAKERDIPSCDGTSTLSPHLHHGEISPRSIYHALISSPHHDKFLSELGWREFSYYLLYHFPQLPDRPWNSAFSHFPWENNNLWLKRWQQGETGYPIVDAGMRQLWETGWMHNRVRMIVASFLIKDLFQPWQKGEKWFWDTLVDADLANNSASWQWVAGCGFDAAPFFRIFNPTLQGKKFDPEGTYIKRWIPELEKCPIPYIHQPEKVKGLSYPSPLVDHDTARKKALLAFKHLPRN